MENYNSFYGVVFYEDKQCLFNFSNFKLTVEINPSKKKDFLNQSGKLGTNILYGKIGNEPKNVLFIFDDVIVSNNFSSLFFTTFNVTVLVKYYFVLDNNLPQENLFIDFRNNAFQKWLGVYPVYYGDEPFSMVDKIRIRKETIEMISSFCIKNKRIIAMPSYYVNFSDTHFDFYSDLRISCIDKMSHDDIYELCINLLHFIKFIYYRFYVDLGDIYITHKIGEKDGKNITEKIGRLFINYNKKEFEPISIRKYFDYGFIEWINIYKHIPQIMSFIEKDELYLFHLPEKRIDRFKTDYPDISLLSAAFESEFSRCFPNYSTNKKNKVDYSDLKEKIEKIEVNEKQKEIVNSIISSFFLKPSLAEKAKYAFDEYKSVLNDFWLDNDKNIDDSIKVFREARNKIDHGDLAFKITHDISNVFYYLRIIILCMQLTRVGIEKDKLSNVIKPVLCLDYNR